MGHILYTDERFRKDDIFDTNIFCEPNRATAEAEGRARVEVEAFLESWRAILNDEYRREAGRDLPERPCSVAALIWPEGMGYNPPDGARYCFEVRPKGPEEATWAVVSEDWADMLVERWGELKGTDEADRIAEYYWSGVPRFYGPGSSNLLIQGKVVVESDCPEEVEFRPRAPGKGALPPGIRRLRRPARWAERIAPDIRRRVRGMEA